MSVWPCSILKGDSEEAARLVLGNRWLVIVGVGKDEDESAAVLTAVRLRQLQVSKIIFRIEPVVMTS